MRDSGESENRVQSSLRREENRCEREKPFSFGMYRCKATCDKPCHKREHNPNPNVRKKSSETTTKRSVHLVRQRDRGIVANTREGGASVARVVGTTTMVRGDGYGLCASWLVSCGGHD